MARQFVSPGRLVRIALAASLLALAAGASADEVELTNGNVYKGRVVEQTDADVTVEVVRGSGKMQIKVPKSTVRNVVVDDNYPAPETAPATSSMPATKPASRPASMLAPTPVPTPTPKPTPTPANPGAMYKDGEFTGSGQGHKSQIQVKITIKDGKIVTAEVVGQNESPAYWARAKDLVMQVVQQQGAVGIKTVTKATRSSNGILNAANDALNKAKL